MSIGQQLSHQIFQPNYMSWIFFKRFGTKKPEIFIFLKISKEKIRKIYTNLTKILKNQTQVICFEEVYIK